jgi:hypothetical protein
MRPLTKVAEGMKHIEEIRKTLPASVPLTDEEKKFSELQERLKQLIDTINTMIVGGRISNTS